MARSKKIMIYLPAAYQYVDGIEAVKFVFKYLADLGFSKYELMDLVMWNSETKKIYEYYVDLLPEKHANISEEKYLGALYLIYKEAPDLLSYDHLCSIVVDKREGFSVKYIKEKEEKSAVIKYKEDVLQWIEMVLEEPAIELDYEVRQAEYENILQKIKEFYDAEPKNSTAYVSFLRPQSDIMNLLNGKVKAKIFPEDEA